MQVESNGIINTSELREGHDGIFQNLIDLKVETVWMRLDDNFWILDNAPDDLPLLVAKCKFHNNLMGYVVIHNGRYHSFIENKGDIKNMLKDGRWHEWEMEGGE